MPYHCTPYCPPRIYAETQAMRRRDALLAAERLSCKDEQRARQAIEEYGERMSDEGRGLLTGLMETLKKVAEATGGRE